MSGIKKNDIYEFNFKKNVLIVCEIALLVTVVILICLVVKGDISLKSPETTKYIINDTTESGIVYKEGLTFAPTEKNEKDNEDKNTTVANNPDGAVNIESPDVQSNNNKVVLPDPSDWSKAQIIAKAREAVNQTKAYTGNLTVSHTEGFSADVTECTGGEIVKSVVNLMIGWVVKPVEETLVYQNGKTVNSEGETVPVLLPKRNNFNLTENGVKSASVQRSGNEYIIKINLVEESVGMYDVPKHNASSIGYLDVANFDISFMEVDSADIVYKGSSIELKINADGYVTYANYKIPLHIDGSAHKGSISGSATFEGEQTEEWRLNW